MMSLMKTTLLLSCLVLSGCTYFTLPAIRDEFDKSIKTYNRMLRWQEQENAGIFYMETGKRNSFMERVESLKKRGVTVTDFRILTSECLPEKKTGTVVTEFDYYILPSNRIKTVTYHQEWVYQELNKSWRLTSELPAFE